MVMFSLRLLRAIGLGLPLAVTATAALAADSPPPPSLSLWAEASEATTRDLLTAELQAQAEGTDPAALADQVNRTMRWALEQAERAGIEARSAGYRTQRLRHEDEPPRWEVVQTVALESGAEGKLLTLVGALQGRLQLTALRYEVSAAARERVQQALLPAALQRWQAQAGIAAAELGRCWVPGQLDVQTPNEAPPMPWRGDMMMMEAKVAPPAAAAGEADIRVQVAGSAWLRSCPDGDEPGSRLDAR